MATNPNIGAVTARITQIAKGKLEKALKEVKPAIVKIAQDALRQELFVSNFYNLVTKSASFRGEFGLKNANLKAVTIILHIVDNIKFSSKSDPQKQSLKIDFGQISYSKLLALPVAKQPNDSKNSTPSHNRKGRDRVLTEIPWLKWLLTSGRSIVVHRYRLEKNTIGVGRSGVNYLMVRNYQQNEEEIYTYHHITREDGYHVSDEYSGYEANNLLTKSLKAAQPAVIAAIKTKALPLIRAAIKANK